LWLDDPIRHYVLCKKELWLGEKSKWVGINLADGLHDLRLASRIYFELCSTIYLKTEESTENISLGG
jgi:hypothetical protein